MEPEASVLLSIPTLRSRVLKAEPAMLLISLWRKELRAEFIEKLLVLPSARYMPVVSMVMATLPRSSFDIVVSSPPIVWSSGASMMNSSPMLLRVLVMITPQSNATLRVVPPSVETVALVRSVAVMFRRGFIGSPVNSTKLPSLMVKVFSGIKLNEYFISPLESV